MSVKQSPLTYLHASFEVTQVLANDAIPNCLAEKWMARANKLILHEGKRKALEVLKGEYLIAVKTAMKLPYEPLSFRKSDKDGFPSAISGFKKSLLSDNNNEVQAALTILRQYTRIRLGIDYSTESITRPGVDITAFREEFTPWLLKWTRKFQPGSLSWDIASMHGTTKAGPNGQATLWSHMDAVSIGTDGPVYNAIKNYCSLTGSGKLMAEIDKYIGIYKDYNHKDELRTAKLSFLQEAAGKTRVIAISDFWTQQALYKIHKELNRFLAGLETDGTYSHNRVAGLTREATMKGLPCHSFDLTTATDRIPRLLEADVIAAIWSKEIADAWLSLISDRAFATNKDESVRYAVGQPMGFYSSWASMALLHHAIVEYCAFTCGYNRFRDYVIIGDDVSIFDNDVADVYERTMKTLDVPISESKTSRSWGGFPSRAEIAKRLFLNGKEISPIPHDVIQASRKDPKVFPMLCNTMLERGVQLTLDNAGTLFALWFPKDKSISLLGIPEGFPGHIKWSKNTSPSSTLTPSTKAGNAIREMWDKIDVERLKEIYLTKRLKSLEEKVARMQKMHTILATVKGNTSAQWTSTGAIIYMHKLGVPIPNSVLKPVTNTYNGQTFHPLLNIVHNEIMGLMDLSDQLELSQDDIQSLDPKEYVPDITISKYLGTRAQLRSRLSSSLMMDSLKDYASLSTETTKTPQAGNNP